MTSFGITEFATRDACLERMVPSNLRKIISDRDKATDELEKLRSEVKRLKIKCGEEPLDNEKVLCSDPSDPNVTRIQYSTCPWCGNSNRYCYDNIVGHWLTQDCPHCNKPYQALLSQINFVRSRKVHENT